MSKLNKSSIANLKGVKENIIKLAENIAKKSDISFEIKKNGGFREAADQYRLFIQKPRVTIIDGYSKISANQTGDGFDISIDDKTKYEYISEIAKEEFAKMKKKGIFSENSQLIWGGEWRRKEVFHFEVLEISEEEE